MTTKSSNNAAMLSNYNTTTTLTIERVMSRFCFHTKENTNNRIEMFVFCRK